jgi:hypothetical protein
LCRITNHNNASSNKKYNDNCYYNNKQQEVERKGGMSLKVVVLGVLLIVVVIIIATHSCPTTTINQLINSSKAAKFYNAEFQLRRRVHHLVVLFAVIDVIFQTLPTTTREWTQRKISILSSSAAVSYLSSLSMKSYPLQETTTNQDQQQQQQNDRRENK